MRTRGRSKLELSAKTCLCGKSTALTPSKLQRHFNVPHCYCFDCKAVFTRHLHQKSNPSHRVGTYSKFPPLHKRLPPTDISTRSTSSTHVVSSAADSLHDEDLEPRGMPGQEPDQDYPNRPRRFTLWCLISDTDDSGRPLRSYSADFAPFCNISLPLELASVEHNPWSPKARRWRDLQKVFEGFLQSNGGCQEIHQSLLTSLISTASDHDESNNAIRTWEQVEQCLKNRTLHAQFCLDTHSDYLVLVLMDTGFPSKSAIQLQYDEIEAYLQVSGTAYNGRTVIHPSREERNAAEHKLSDIRALDEIARVQGTWRPTTCFGYGDCALVGTKNVMKRAWSCSSSHVKTSGDYTSRLTCNLTRPRRTKKVKNEAVTTQDDQGTWFHQEYVEALAKTELRVFIATRPDPAGTRGLRGEVVRVCCTRPAGNDDIIATEAIDDTYESLGTTKETVQSFSLGVFGALRDHSFGWSRRFESLEVGCRLDVSLRGPGGSLFVNEITRWNGAHYFSDYCTGAPHALICNAYAKSWACYLSSWES